MPSAREKELSERRQLLARRARSAGIGITRAIDAVREQPFAHSVPQEKTTGSRQKCVHCRLTITRGQMYRATLNKLTEYIHEDCYQQRQSP